MSTLKSGTDHWDEIKQILRAKVDEFYSGLETAYTSANQTFSDRLAKTSSHTLTSTLTACQQAMEANYKTALKHRKFCEKHIEESDRVYREAVGDLIKSQGSNDRSPFIENAENVSAAKIVLGTSKILIDALSLCALLAGLLGHKEAHAFEKGALKELGGAIFDPGSGVITLLKRLYAVASRTLRSDQDADELFSSLETFQKIMTQWRLVMKEMSQGKPFSNAVKETFEEWVASKP